MKLIESLLKTAIALINIFKKEVPREPVIAVKPTPPFVPEPTVVNVPFKLYETVPMPTANKSMSAAIDTLQAVEFLTGVKARDMALIINIESSFDYTVKASTSSATGWFQFINKTWGVVLERYGKLYDIPNTTSSDLRLDPRISALMGAELIKENIKIIKPAIGRELTLLEIYLAHFFGSGNAKKFLQLKEDAIAADVFPTQAKANEWVFFSAGKPRTVAQIKTYLEGRIKKSIDLADKTFP